MFRNVPLDLGNEKRKSMSPDSKRSAMGAAGYLGSPEKVVANPLLPGGGGANAKITGITSGMPGGSFGADLMPIKQ